MRIDAIDVYWLKLPLAFVWKTSYADQHVTDTILVRMEGGGHHAWGESCPPYIPGYSADHTLAVYHTLREHMVPRIIGQEVETSQDILDRLAFIKGNQFARAALDIAWWVLDAKRRGLPLHRALGGTADRVAVGADFGIQDSLDLLMAKVQGAVDAGFPRVKLKFRPAGTCSWWRRCGRPSPTSPCTSTATRPTRRPTPPCSAPWTASTRRARSGPG